MRDDLAAEHGIELTWLSNLHTATLPDQMSTIQNLYFLCTFAFAYHKIAKPLSCQI